VKILNKKVVREEPKRSVLKTITWRIIATSTTMLLVYVFTGQFELSAGVGVGDLVSKMVFYFLHERVWNRISFGRSLGGTVESVMRSPPVTALQLDVVSKVVERMIKFDIGAVVVSEGHNNCGLITERDILEKVLKASKDPGKTYVKDIMSSPLATIGYGKSLEDVLNVMANKHIRRLVVTKEGKAVGIVTERRILRALVPTRE
jgi:predicted transcriptional regulator